MLDRNREQIELVIEELADLDQQITTGDIDAETADSLRGRYVEELDRLRNEYTQDEQVLDDAPETAARLTSRLSQMQGRAIAGTAIVVVSVAITTVFAIVSLSEAGVAGAEGVVGDVLTGDNPIDISTISDEEMEAVVAQNPEVVGMRLALARRYFNAGDFSRALDHYMIILSQEQHPEALANVGWMTYMSGRPDIALGYIEAALQRQPGSLAALWLLANVQHALGNYAEAAEALTIVLDAEEGVPDNVRVAATALLVEMESG